MYVRARPYVNEKELLNCLMSENPRTDDRDQTCLFFNSASAGLKWFLTTIREQKQTKLKVGVQVLTCQTVNNAIIESGNIPVYMDISPSSFTTLTPIVEQHRGIDILLLSHLYGIANPDYLLIRDWCRNHKIILINDLAQTVQACIENCSIEDYGDYYLYSFAFDKPIAAGSGGMLKVRAEDEHLIKEYKKVPHLSKSKSKNLLKKFCFYHALTDSNVYQKEFRYDTWVERLIIKVFATRLAQEPLSKVYFIVLSSRFNKIQSIIERSMRRLLKFSCSHTIEVQKIGEYQLAYLLAIREETEQILERYHQSYELCKYQLQKMNLTDGLVESYNAENARCGQRITLLHTARDELIKTLRAKKIEAGAYNWPQLICLDSEKTSYPNALACTETLINVPTWSEHIWST